MIVLFLVFFYQFSMELNINYRLANIEQSQ